MTMTSKEFLEYLIEQRSNLEFVMDTMDETLKTLCDTNPPNKITLQWERAHLNASWFDLLNDVNRTIKTLEGKEFNAG